DFLHFNSPFSDAFFENSDEKNKGKELEKNDQLRNLLEECIKTNPTLIPYSELTNIIFTVDTTYSNKNFDTTFTEKLKSDMENFITKKYLRGSRPSTKKNNEDVFGSEDTKDSSLVLDKKTQDGILVFYKIIQHTELALAQKESLYESQREDINELHNQIFDTSEKYNIIVSSFISIYGIFVEFIMYTFIVVLYVTSLIFIL